jgi:hypothetical protein
MERLAGNGVDSQFEMVGGDGACYVGREGEDSFDCFGGGGVFEDDSELGE